VQNLNDKCTAKNGQKARSQFVVSKKTLDLQPKKRNITQKYFNNALRASEGKIKNT
jgi:hypothetical protein